MKPDRTEEAAPEEAQPHDTSLHTALVLPVDAGQAGQRLDSFLAGQVPAVSRTRLQRAIADEDVLVNEHASKPSYKLRAGDQVEVDLPEPPLVDLTPEPLPLDIVYEDDDLIVIDKPAGMVVHPGAGIHSGTLANALVYHFGQLSGTPGRVRPGIVHRIDKDTSGLLVVAKNDWTHDRLSKQFSDRRVTKYYLALVYGRISKERGEIETPIGRNPTHRTRMAVRTSGGGRPAHTVYEVQHRSGDFTLVRVQIKTGRTHQIRVHFASIGHPVVGDSTYGGGRENSLKPAVRRQVQALNRHFLHSEELAFVHPRSGERMKFTSPLPSELEEFLSKATAPPINHLRGSQTSE
jgi:23S rRNA pseudouridine1911/1915/1917 synthase